MLSLVTAFAGSSLRASVHFTGVILHIAGPLCVSSVPSAVVMGERCPEALQHANLPLPGRPTEALTLRPRGAPSRRRPRTRTAPAGGTRVTEAHPVGVTRAGGGWVFRLRGAPNLWGPRRKAPAVAHSPARPWPQGAARSRGGPRAGRAPACGAAVASGRGAARTWRPPPAGEPPGP